MTGSSAVAAHLSNIIPPGRRLFPLYATAGAASLALFAALLRSFSVTRLSQTTRPVLPSPRTTLLPALSESELQSLPYPPDALPGGRDVESPYGTFRVHEWGPEGGQKVLMVHGISTPLVAFAPIARLLVERGYRVMLFDLFGRGYSDGPSDLPYDSRLYTSQILLALQSSPLPWTGNSKANAFHLLGYSLGGGISADFASYFPHLISSLVLIAPSGIVRDTHVTWKSKLLYNTRGLLPETLVHWLVSRRLYTSPSSPAPTSTDPESSVLDTSTSTPTTAQVQAPGSSSISKPPSSSPTPTTNTDPYHLSPTSRPFELIPNRPHITVPATVNFQLTHHPAFTLAFVSSIRHAPIHSQHARWRVIGARLSAQNAHPEDAGARRMGLLAGKVLILLGRGDEIVLEGEVGADAEAVLGRGNVEIRVLEAGHEVVMSMAGECVEAMVGLWERGGGEEMMDMEVEKGA